MKKIFILFFQVILVFSYIVGMEKTKKGKSNLSANEMLMEAAMQGDIARAQEAITNGADIINDTNHKTRIRKPTAVNSGIRFSYG